MFKNFSEISILMAVLIMVTAAYPYESLKDDIEKEKVEKTDHDVLCNNSNITIKFSHLQLGSLEESFLSTPLITCLDLSNNYISQISEKAFDNLPNLRYLDMKFNQFDVHDILCINFLNLETLILDYTRVSIIDFTIGGYYPKLRHLFLRNIGFNGIRANSKNNLPFLTHLYLSGNRISYDNFDWLPDTLEYLDLTDHQLESLTLSNLKKLKWVFLDKNERNDGLIRELNFANLISLIYLSVPSNAIQEISTSTFVNTTSLLYLDISDNNIRNIAVGSFNSMANLEFLNISKNNIEIMEDGLFDTLSNLRTLVLEKNIISMFPRLMKTIKLETLFLNCNKIKTIYGRTFAKMPDLDSLYLHDNEISYIDPDAFVGLEKLKILTLSNNRLSQLPPNWILPMLSLEELDLSGNGFLDMNDLSMSEASNLKNLYLSKQLLYIKAQSMFSLPENVTINLDENFNFVEKCVKSDEEYGFNRRYG